MARASTAYLAGTFSLVLLLTGLTCHSCHDCVASHVLLTSLAAMVSRLGLTDLCLFTEASYTPSFHDRSQYAVPGFAVYPALLLKLLIFLLAGFYLSALATAACGI